MIVRDAIFANNNIKKDILCCYQYNRHIIIKINVLFSKNFQNK